MIVTSNMAPVRFLPSACSRICMVSFGMVRRPSTATFAQEFFFAVALLVEWFEADF